MNPVVAAAARAFGPSLRVGRCGGRRPCRFRLVLALALGAVLVGPTLAEEFPSRPVRLVTPFPAASTTDKVARPIAQRLADVWKQPVVVDNRAGAGGVVGAQAVATAAPDGYTLLLGSNGTNAINAALYPQLPYDVIKSFAPVAQVATSNLVLVVHPSVNVKTVSELIALAKRAPGKLTFGSGGSGTSPYLAGELFNTMAGVKLMHVPYKGSPQSVLDLLAGRVDMIFANASSVLPHVRTGKLRMLGVTSPQRDPMFAEVPTIAEAGLPGFAVEVWMAIFAPAGTPPALVDKLSQQIRAAVESEDVKRELASQGLLAKTSSPQALAIYVRDETVKWARVVRESGAKVD